MKLEIINKNKLKIAFTSEELEENGISVHSFLSNSKVIKKFIYAILEIAEEELNFTYKNYNYTLESFSFNHTHFIIYITTKSKLISSSPQLYQDNSLILFIFHNQNEFIEFLKTNNLGRVTFFPLNIIKEKYIPDGLHPNDKGNEIIADRLGSFLINL